MLGMRKYLTRISRDSFLTAITTNSARCSVYSSVLKILIGRALNIAVFLELSEEQSGGSFKFNKLIYDNLLSRKDELEHKLYFVFNSRNELGLKPDIALPSIFQHRISLVNTFIQQLLKFLLRGQRISLQNCQSAFLNKKLSKLEIRAVWSVNPLASPTNVPFVTTSWDISHKVTPYFPEISESGNALAKRDRICKSVFDQAFRIIVGTDQGRNELESVYGVVRERIKVQPLPVEIAKFNDIVIRERLKFIYPANFWTHKNHHVIVHAVNALRNDADLPIKIIFTGSDRGNLQKIQNLVSRYELNSQFVFKGFVDSRELESLYRSSNSCIFPSFIGPDNLPPLEALSFGARAIVSDIPGARDQFGEFATYFNPYDPSSLANQIKTAVHNFDAKSDSPSGLNDFLLNRSPRVYIKSIMDEFKKLEVLLS